MHIKEETKITKTRAYIIRAMSFPGGTNVIKTMSQYLHSYSFKFNECRHPKLYKLLKEKEDS